MTKAAEQTTELELSAPSGGPVPVEASSAVSVLQVIDRAAKDPSTDVDKLERLLGMYERIEMRNAEIAFNSAMVAAQAEMPQVFKGAKSQHGKFANLQQIMAEIMPIVSDHGLSMSFGTDSSPLPEHYRVTCRVSHRDGHSEKYFADVPADVKGAKGSDVKTAIHGFGSSMSYGRRYLTMLIFNIATTDDDDGNSVGGVMTEEQRENIKDLLQRSNTDPIAMCRYFAWEAVDKAPAKDYRAAVGQLEAKIAVMES